MSTNEGVFVFGNQLFPLQHFEKFKSHPLFMAEVDELCSYYKFHQQKIALFFQWMREQKKEFETNDFQIHYHFYTNKKTTLFELWSKWIETHQIKKMHFYEIEDVWMEKKVIQFFKKKNVEVTFHASPMFICSRDEFKKYLKSQKKPWMKTFYEGIRKEHKVLVEKDLTPKGGKWSFDVENRKKLPKNVMPPFFPEFQIKKDFLEIKKLIGHHFQDHPGNMDDFPWPKDQSELKKWISHFLNQNLSSFGAYEDAIEPSYDILFHSALSPLINLGVLPPKLWIDMILEHYKKNPKIPLSSVEGIIRQILGWREFVHGINQNFGEKQEEANFFQHHRKLKGTWWDASTGLKPLDDVIKKVLKNGYCHHIERLMIISNIMLLSEIHPKEVYRWFMEMFVDSSDWVMGPNVFGMGQFSDGGIFATKPYLCASNYILKMSSYKKEPWCETLDALYWCFIDKNKVYFSSQPRLSMMTRMLQKKDSNTMKKYRILQTEWLKNNTTLEKDRKS